MATKIQKLYEVWGELVGKNIATDQPPERIDSVLYHVILSLYNEYLDHYVKTKKISDYMLPFKRVKTISMTSGVGQLPPDYNHTRELYNSANGKSIDLVEDKFWANRANGKTNPPSATSPIARIEYSESDTPSRQIEVLPTSVASVKMYYFKTPSIPKYGYTASNNRYVYDEDSTTDIEFPVGLMPDIIKGLILGFGINLRENQLIQVSQIVKDQMK